MRPQPGSLQGVFGLRVPGVLRQAAFSPPLPGCPAAPRLLPPVAMPLHPPFPHRDGRTARSRPFLSTVPQEAKALHPAGIAVCFSAVRPVTPVHKEKP